MLLNQINGQPYSAIAASFSTWLQWSCLIFTGELNDENFSLVLMLILAPFASHEVAAHGSTQVIQNNCINNIQGAISWNYEGRKR